MTVCANRTDNPGIFTTCALARGGCLCSRQVLEEYVDQATREAGARATAERVLKPQLRDRDRPTFVPWTCPACHDTAQVRTDLRDVRCGCGVVSRAPEPLTTTTPPEEHHHG